MSFGSWMVPELSIAAAAQLEQNKRAIRQNITEAPESVADVLCAVLEQNANYSSILRKATLRIAELEVREALDGYGELPLAPADTPWYLRLALWVAGYRLTDLALPDEA